MPPVKPVQGFFDSGPETLSIADRGVSYGHGVFETLRVCNGQLPLLEWHLGRLEQGCRMLKIPFSEKQVLLELRRLLAKARGESAVIKLIVTAGCADRGYQVQHTLNPAIVGQVYEYGGVDRKKLEEGVSLYLCNYQLPLNPCLAGIKHLNRLDQVLAAFELEGQNCEEALLRDTRGNIVEALSRNIFMKRGNRWVTPNLELCGVAGVMRRYLLEEIFPRCEIPVSVEDVGLDQLQDCGEMFVCNAVSGIWPVTSISGQAAWQGIPGTGTRVLIKGLEALQPCFRV